MELKKVAPTPRNSEEFVWKAIGFFSYRGYVDPIGSAYMGNYDLAFAEAVAGSASDATKEYAKRVDANLHTNRHGDGPKAAHRGAQEGSIRVARGTARGVAKVLTWPVAASATFLDYVSLDYSDPEGEWNPLRNRNVPPGESPTAQLFGR